MTEALDIRCVIRGDLDAYDATFPCGCKVSRRHGHTYRRINPTCVTHSVNVQIPLKRGRHVCTQCGRPAMCGRADGARITYLCHGCAELVEEVVALPGGMT
jgi:hypothetical protein